MLRRVFGPKRNEVTGEWRKLNNKESCDLYCSQNNRAIKSRRWVGHVASTRGSRGTYRVSVGRPESGGRRRT